jgi:hypothetical protein
MKRFQLSIAMLILFATGFLLGYLYKPVFSDTRNTLVIAKGITDSVKQVNCDELMNKKQHDMESMLIHASDVLSELESDNQALLYQIMQLRLDTDVVPTETYLSEQIDRLPESFIEQQLEFLFDEKYLVGIDDKKAFAKNIAMIALADVDDANIDPAAENNTYVDIVFSLSPVYGLRQFSTIDNLERDDTIFAHFTSTIEYPDLIVRWQHASSGEILRMSPLALHDNQNGYISLKPDAGWKTGSYQVSLFDVNDNKRLIGSYSYNISNVIESENRASHVDRDVINDLISSGIAAPKS